MTSDLTQSRAQPQHDLLPVRWWRRLTWLCLGLLVLVYAGWVIYVIRYDRPLDFYVYYLAAETFARGENAYTISDPDWDALAAELGITNYTRPYRYPPLTAQIVAPLRIFGAQAAASIWLVLSAGAMIGGAWWLASLFRAPYRRAVSLGLLLLLVPPLTTLLAGQVNAAVYLCLALGLVWLQRDQRLGAAFALAAGALLKVLPLALILYLLWRKQWRAGLLGLGALLLLWFAAAPFVGWQGTVSYLQSALDLARPDTLYTTPTNQTISAFLGRLFQSTTSADVLSLSRWVTLSLIAATALICIPRGDFKRFLVAEVALIVAATQIIAPFTWYHQLLLLHIPLVVVCMHALARRQWWLLALMLGLTALVDIHGLFWHQIEASLGNGWWLSFPFVLALALWLALAFDIVQRKWRQGEPADG